MSARRGPRETYEPERKSCSSLSRARMRAIQETFPARSDAKNRGTNQLMDVYEINDWPTRASRSAPRIETLPGLRWEILDERNESVM